MLPAVQIVEGKQIVARHRGALPALLAHADNLSLDLRATIAGNNAAALAILGLVERYGAAVVKGVMRRALDASQRAFEQALETIPDGVCSERLIQEVSMNGDRGTYPVADDVRKTGDAS